MRNLFIVILCIFNLKGFSQLPPYITTTKFFNQPDLTPPDIAYPNLNGGKNYYVNADAGNNLNTGLGLFSAWQDLSRVNTALGNGSIVPGDSILFKRGQKWYGRLVSGTSGTSARQVTVGKYGGAGVDPIITAFVNPSVWTLHSTGIYKTTMSAWPVSFLNNVMLDGTQRAVGRYPNFNTVAEGWLPYDSSNGSTSTGGTITISSRSTLPFNWVGAEIVIKVRNWVINKGPITAVSGKRISYTQGSAGGYLGANGFGYFVQRDLRTLDQYGEWYFDKVTHVLYMYLGSELPTNHEIKVSTIDTLAFITGRSYLSFAGINFEGANSHGIYINGGQTFKFVGCSFTKGGKVGLQDFFSPNIVVDGCTFTDNLNSGLYFRYTNGTALNWQIINNYFRNTGIIVGMEMNGDNSTQGGRTPIGFAGSKTNTAGSPVVVQYNHMVNSGYAGIEFSGSYVDISYNVVDTSALVKDDVGGIYTFEALGRRTQNGGLVPFASYSRLIKKNIVMTVIGNINGTNSPVGKGRGIYLDNNANNVKVDSNFVYNTTLAGLYNNDIWEVKFNGNIIYDCTIGWQTNRFGGNNYADTMFNIRFVNNQFFPYTSSFQDLAIDSPYVRTISQDLQRSLTQLDSSKYFLATTTPINTVDLKNNGSSYHEFNQPFSYLTGLGKETHSTVTFSSTQTLIFIYNESKIARAFGTPGTVQDVNGVSYTGGTITLQPYETKVLRVMP